MQLNAINFIIDYSLPLQMKSYGPKNFWFPCMGNKWPFWQFFRKADMGITYGAVHKGCWLRRIPVLILYLFSGNRLKCVSCRIIVHESCSVSLNDLFTCRPSFCESVRKYREFTSIPHHWVQRKQLKVRINTNITISEVNE